MAEKNESSLIGYDPLAWMHQQGEEPQAAPVPVEYVDADPETAGQAWVEMHPEQEIEDTGWQELASEITQGATPMVADSSIVLEPVLNIQNVAQLHERLLSALDNGNKIEIDASAVTVADTSTLQLLLILKRTAIKQRKEVVIDFPSDKFIEAAELLGISEMLEVDQAAAGFF